MPTKRTARKVEPLVRTPAHLGESPRWDAASAALWWVDIDGRRLHRTETTGETRTESFTRRVCVATPRARGGLLLALEDRLCHYDPDAGETQPLLRVPQPSDVRLNDGACDPAGRFWVGSMAYDERHEGGRLYRLDPGRTTLEPVLDPVTLSNSLGWSPDGATMYYVDSARYALEAWDYASDSGRISNRRELVRLHPSDGIPDGFALDHDGAVWLALCGTGRIHRYTPEGRLDRVIELPTPNVTACAFGGPEGELLFVTTAADELPPDTDARGREQAGWLFVTAPGVTGPPATPFAG